MNTEDSLEKIKEDAVKLAYKYWNCESTCDCKDCPSRIDEQKPYEYYGASNCLEAMNLDIIERTVEVIKCNVVE